MTNARARWRNQPKEILVDGIRYVPDTQTATRVTVWGMYEMHIFHKIEGRTVDEIIQNWLDHNSKKQPAIVGEDEVEDLGPSMLCPATVFCGEKELRSVGNMVFPNEKERRGQPESAELLEEYRAALKADPDIERLLASQ